MASYPGIRASDEDRGRVAAALGDHYAAGRLTLEEFRERLDKAYAASTLGELDDLMADLPGTDLAQLPGAGPGRPSLPQRRVQGPVQVPGGGSAEAWSAAMRFWLGMSLCLFVIWLVSGASGGPWFLWAAVPLSIVLLRRYSHRK